MIKFDLDQRVGDPFIKRPAFVTGTRFQQILSPTKPDFPVRKRALDREGRLRRKAFKLTGPVARPAKTIEEIEALKTKQQGIKIRLGPGQFGKVRVAKRDASGNVVKDEEGNIIFELKEFNISMATLPLQDRLEILQDALLTGIGTKMNEVAVTLASILSSNEDVKNLTDQNAQMLALVLKSAQEASGEPLVTNPRDVEAFRDLPDGRFVTKEIWNSDESLQAAVILFLMGASATDPRLTPLNPIFGTAERGGTIKYNSIGSQINIGDERVLDLGSRRLFKDQETADSLAGERVELESQKVADAEAQAVAEEEKEAAEDDPTVAGATSAATAVTSVLDDPSVPGAAQTLSETIQEQSTRPTQQRDPFGTLVTEK